MAPVMRVGPLAGKDIDQLWNALRPRIIGLGRGGTAIAGPQGPAGPKGVVWRGAWAADNDYDEGDLVTDATVPGGSPLTYFCLQPHTSVAGNRPTVGGDANWHEINEGYLFTDGSRPYVLSPSHSHLEGCLAWDPGTSLKRLLLDVDNSTRLPWGSVIVRVVNNTGTTLAALRPVRALSSTSGVIEVELAGTGSGLDVFPLGVTMHAIADGAEGWVCCHGHMGGVDTSSWADGNVLYVQSGNTLGTTIPGKGCGVEIRMAMVVSAANPGSLFVSIERRPNLGELSNVDDDSNGGPAYYDVPMFLPLTEGCDAYRDYPASLFPSITIDNGDTPYSVPEKAVFIHVDAGAGAVTVTLPSATGSTARNGRVLHVKKIDATRNVVTIDGAGSETIDGEASQYLTLPLEQMSVVCDTSINGWRAL